MADLKTAQTEFTHPKNSNAKVAKAKALASAPSSYVSKIPPEVMGEYRLLSRKKLMNPLSDEEEARLKAAMDVINEYSLNSPGAQAWQAKSKEIEAELKSIRAEAEALIAAHKKNDLQKKHP